MSTVLITGAGRGIGLATARAFKQGGWKVLALDKDFSTFDLDVERIQFDLRDIAKIKGLVEKRQIDTLVNNAGVYISKPFTDYTAADYALASGVNLAGFFWITQRAVAEMATGTAATWSTSPPPWPRSRTPASPRCWRR